MLRDLLIATLGGTLRLWPISGAPVTWPLARKPIWCDFLSDLPVGQFCVESSLQKYFCFHSPRNTSRTLAIPPHQRGVSRSSRTRDGMRWTRQRFARDGLQGRLRPVSNHQACGREMLQRTAKSCGPDAPTLASSSRMASRLYRAQTSCRSADDGGKRARSPGRARSKPLKPLRAGMPDDSGVLVVTRVRSITTSAHETAGATGIRHSPRPLWARE